MLQLNYMQIQNIFKYKLQAQMGSRVSQSSEKGLQGQSQTENIVLETQSQSKQKYYYKKRGWDHMWSNTHVPWIETYTASERGKKIACILHRSLSSSFFLN